MLFFPNIYQVAILSTPLAQYILSIAFILHIVSSSSAKYNQEFNELDWMS